MIEKDIFVVIPAYNEAKTIANVVGSVMQEGYENVVVVDDGSRDSTYKKAKEAGAMVVQHIVNRGPGAATQTGIDYCRSQSADYVLTMDADSQHVAKDIPKLISKIETTQTDIVIGNRFHGGNKVPLLRVWFNKFANFVTLLLTGIKTKDSQSGMKVFGKRAIKKLNIRTSGFEFCTEIFMQAKLHKLSIAHEDIKVIYTIESLEKGQHFAAGLNTAFKLFLEAISR